MKIYQTYQVKEVLTTKKSKLDLSFSHACLMVKGARQEKTGCVAMDHAMGALGMLSV